MNDFEKDFENDCSKFAYKYIPHKLDDVSRVIAIGDIHGDLDVAVNFLILAKCIEKLDEKPTRECVILINKNEKEEYYVWSGFDTVVIQVGDQIDRCRPINDMTCIYPDATVNDESSDIKIMEFYTKMNNLARKEGGWLVSLLGNHELMNVNGNMNYVSYKGLEQFVDTSEIKMLNSKMDIAMKGLEARKKAFLNLKRSDDKGERLNEFLACSRTSSIIVNGMLFVHGGLVEMMANAYDVQDINKIVRKWLLGKMDKSFLKTKKEKRDNGNNNFDNDNRVHEILFSKNSIFWNRILGNLPSDLDIENLKNAEQLCKEYVDSVFKIYKINGIIIGHTPQTSEKYGVNSACNQKVWRVDIGASSAFDSLDANRKKRIEVLEMKFDNGKTLFNILKMK